MNIFIRLKELKKKYLPKVFLKPKQLINKKT